MSIFTYLVATSTSEKKLGPTELIDFIYELLNTGTFTLPVAILVGQARTLPYYWGDVSDSYITPIAPGFMLDLDDTDFPRDLIWYYGTDERVFQVALSQTPFGEKDCCISFPNGWNGWDGGVIYALKQPFPLDLRGSEHALVHHYVTSCFILFSMIGGGGAIQDTCLQTILANHLGSDLLLEEVIDW